MAANSWKEWERPLIELEAKIAKLRETRSEDPREQARIEATVRDGEKRIEEYIDVVYSRLGPWEKVLVARAEKRPYTLDYITAMFTDFQELEGDRRFGSDHAIVGGPALLDGQAVMIVGHQKGRNIQDRQYRNFAMAKPEGYRKAIRLFQMADRFRMPIVTFVDTPAADPSVESEGRGISEALADSMLALFDVKVPVVSVVIGEGGSGGALAIAVANTVLMLEHSIYSVIPPEGCAAILWRKPEMAAHAAAALKLTAQSAFELELIDEILPEPRGGAHRDMAEVSATVKSALVKELQKYKGVRPEDLQEHRYEKFRKMGKFASVDLTQA